MTSTYSLTGLLCALLLSSLTTAAAVDTAATQQFLKAEPYEALAGGETTYQGKIDRNILSHPSANLSFDKRLDFRLGDSVFRKLWVSSPSSTTASDGLGPLYNARACQQCHIRDGRGHTPENAGDNAISMFLRLSIPAQTEQQKRLLEQGRIGTIPEPTYGGQLQDFAVTGLAAEGQMQILWQEQIVTLADGTEVSLRRPEYSITDLSYGPLHPQTRLSPRIAPPMTGLGLLEAIPTSDILSQEDPNDIDDDGISGRANRVWDSQQQQVVPGRFGWKAGNPTLLQQNSGAFNGDIGISTTLKTDPYGDCTNQQPTCRQQPHGNTPAQDDLEASHAMSELLLFYTRNLAVPARRDVNLPEVLAGKKLFYTSGCQSCHRPKYRTGDHASMPEQSGQLIWPYTDLLLHDMGEGLADNRPEFAASGREWRTPPLWGIGLTQIANGHTQYLHDGRARNLLEAILWHGGEAEPARNQVINMSSKERGQLLRFLESL